MASQTHSSIFDPLDATDDVSNHNNNGTSSNAKVQESMTLTLHVEREGQPAPSTTDSGITTKCKGPGRPKKKKSDETGVCTISITLPIADSHCSSLDGSFCIDWIIFSLLVLLCALWWLSAEHYPGAPSQDFPPTAPRVTYYLSIFSELELRKAEKQWKSINSFLQQAADLPFDTLKAQLLAQISVKLNPNNISYDNYDITWTVP